MLSGLRDAGITKRLHEIRRDAESYHLDSVALPVHTLQVVHLQMLGRDAEALVELCTLLQHIDTPFASEMLRAYTDARPGTPFGFSETERCVLHRLAGPNNTPQIDATTFVNVGTVRTRVQNICRKMLVHDRDPL